MNSFKYNKELNNILKNYTKVFLLVDENSMNSCLPLLDINREYDTILIQSGEINKTIEVSTYIWSKLLEFRADRDSVLINLGGGVITDMGGFVASTYKRGIDFINIPTTLLAQVDATTGGKTAINFLEQKNMVGLFVNPKKVFIDTIFLKTLSDRELKNGLAEVLKHGLILDKNYLYFVLDEIKKDRADMDWTKIVDISVELKTKVVEEDFRESGKRKILNFGHTVGHALESYSLKNHKEPLKHGEAVILGMILAINISIKNYSIDKNSVYYIIEELKSIYNFSLEKFNIVELVDFMGNDKKNRDKKILFVLLKDIGVATYNNIVSKKDINKELYLLFSKL